MAAEQAEQVEQLRLEVQKLSTENAENHQNLLSTVQDLSSRIESLSSELRKLTPTISEAPILTHTSIRPVHSTPVRSYTVSGMYGYVEAISLDSLTDSQKSRLDSGLRGFLNGGVPLTEPVGLEAWAAFSERFIKFLEEVGIQVQKNWLGFTHNDTTKAGINAHKLQALHLYHGYALESPNSLLWYTSSRTMETFRLLCLARGLL